ncbi:pyridoxamine 5'-phosphate oxidase family protein [Microbacterium sp. NPDC091313]
MSTPTRTVEVQAPVIDHATDPVHGPALADAPEPLARAWVPGPGQERMLMTLATIDRDGFPATRTVMLSDFDGDRFHFHTDARSRKAADLLADPRVSLTLLWPAFTRQLVVQGTALPVTAAEAAEAYALRSPYLRQLAWVNDATMARRPLATREERWADFEAQHPDPDPPDTWVGYAVRPHRYVFWVSHPAAPSRRLEFVRAQGGWRRSVLPG